MVTHRVIHMGSEGAVGPKPYAEGSYPQGVV